MKSLIIGGAGFIGSNLADALKEKGHDITILDDLSTGSYDNIKHLSCEFIKFDITQDFSKLTEGRPHFDYIFHLAAQIDVRKSMANPQQTININVNGTRNILNSFQPPRKFVFASTGGAIYGDTDQIPTTEQHPCVPESVYGQSKLDSELILERYSEDTGVDTVCLRYGNVYGPRQNSKGEAGVVAIFIDKILAGEQPIINGDGKQTRDYVFVEDVVSANIAAIENNIQGIFNVGTSIETNVNQIYQKIAEKIQANVPEVHGPGKEGEQKVSCLSYEKLNTTVGWTPKFDIDKGIEKTVEFFINKYKHIIF